jgi:hypothetical protein
VESGVESEIGVSVVGLQGESSLLAVDITLDIEFVDLRDPQQKVSGSGQLVGVLGDESRDCPKG